MPAFNADAADYAKLLATLTPFADHLATLLSDYHPDIATLIADGDNVARVVHRPAVRRRPAHRRPLRVRLQARPRGEPGDAPGRLALRLLQHLHPLLRRQPAWSAASSPRPSRASRSSSRSSRPSPAPAPPSTARASWPPSTPPRGPVARHDGRPRRPGFERGGAASALQQIDNEIYRAARPALHAEQPDARRLPADAARRPGDEECRSSGCPRSSIKFVVFAAVCLALLAVLGIKIGNLSFFSSHRTVLRPARRRDRARPPATRSTSPGSRWARCRRSAVQRAHALVGMSLDSPVVLRSGFRRRPSVAQRHRPEGRLPLPERARAAGSTPGRPSRSATTSRTPASTRCSNSLGPFLQSINPSEGNAVRAQPCRGRSRATPPRSTSCSTAARRSRSTVGQPQHPGRLGHRQPRPGDAGDRIALGRPRLAGVEPQPAVPVARVAQHAARRRGGEPLPGRAATWPA